MRRVAYRPLVLAELIIDPERIGPVENDLLAARRLLCRSAHEVGSLMSKKFLLLFSKRSAFSVLF
jgi:hypothetical protein